MNKMLVYVIFIMSLSSCGISNEEVVELAKEEYDRKVQILREEQRLICIKSALEEAERQADSIIFQMRINPLGKSLYRPRVPPKPSYIITDSTVINSKHSVKPILDSTIIK